MATPLSVQLYTLRDQIAADRDGTLTRLADIGLPPVEPYDPTADPAGFRKPADDLGLTRLQRARLARCSARTPAPVFDAVATIGTDLAIIPAGIAGGRVHHPRRPRSGPPTSSTAAPRRPPRHGLRIGYHNHWWEFEPRLRGPAPPWRCWPTCSHPRCSSRSTPTGPRSAAPTSRRCCARLGDRVRGAARQGRPGGQGRAERRGRHRRDRRALGPGRRAAGRLARRRVRRAAPPTSSRRSPRA